MINDFNSLKDDEAALSLFMGDSIYFIKEKGSYTSFNYEGENNKYVLMLVDDPKHPYIAPAGRDMFDKLLAAVRLQWRDIAIVNLASYPGVQINDLKKFFTCNKVIFWGTNPATLGCASEKYGVTSVDGMQVLWSDPLDVLAKFQGAKKQLWGALQKMFSI